MTEPPAASVTAPKRRALFKRPAWQNKPQNEDADIFRHANEFTDLVAEQARRKEEERKEKKRDRKRRRISNNDDENNNKDDDAIRPAAPERAARIDSSKERSITPISPRPAHSPPDSLSARYDSLTKPTCSSKSLTRSMSSSHSLAGKDSHVIQLDDSDDGDYGSSIVGHKPQQMSQAQELAVRPSVHHALGKNDDQDDELEEIQDPIIAALEAKAQARAQLAANTKAVDSTPAPIAHLFIEPEMDNARPLMVKVRIDNPISKPRTAWCKIQNFTPQMTDSVFFTWNGTRLYDSTTIKRLGIQVDDKGNVTVEGDSNIYDDVNLPKIHVQAWTEELFRERKKQDAEAKAAKKAAAEAPVVIEDRFPTPEPAPAVTKIRLTLRAKGREDFKLSVKPDTTFAHIASAYKTKLKIPNDQPVTLMFDGERLVPIDTVADCELEDKDTLDVLFN
ncbi:SMT3 Ubiquitin protein [Pyrenophora tritici-repentis]|nr:SMT3 Ubiquitin protein [Pyrenophora tritici-repentis]